MRLSARVGFLCAYGHRARAREWHGEGVSSSYLMDGGSQDEETLDRRSQRTVRFFRFGG